MGKIAVKGNFALAPPNHDRSGYAPVASERDRASTEVSRLRRGAVIVDRLPQRVEKRTTRFQTSTPVPTMHLAGAGGSHRANSRTCGLPAESCDSMMKYARDLTSVCLNGTTSAPDLMSLFTSSGRPSVLPADRRLDHLLILAEVHRTGGFEVADLTHLQGGDGFWGRRQPETPDDDRARPVSIEIGRCIGRDLARLSDREDFPPRHSRTAMPLRTQCGHNVFNTRPSFH